jgi:WD40 repeat protein
VAGGDNWESMHVYEFNSNKPISSYSGFNSDVTWVRFSYDESKIYAGSFGGTLFVYNYERGRVWNTFRGHLTHWRWVVDQKSELANYIVSGAADTNIKVWDFRQKAAIATYKGHNKAISALDISPDTSFVASGWTGGKVKIWDLTAGKWSYTFDVGNMSQNENWFIKDIKFNPADCWMAVAWSDKVVRYYDASTYELINESSPDVHPIANIEFDPDGETVISSYSDSIKVWNLEQKKLVSIVSKTARPVFDLRTSLEADFTFILESVSGTLGLSQISTNLITNKTSEVEDYEEEKKIDGNNGNRNQANGPENYSTDTTDRSGGNLPKQPLDFYTAPNEISKATNGVVLNNGYDFAYGVEDSNDLDNIEETSYDAPGFQKVQSYPENSQQSKLPKKLSRKQKSRKKIFCNNGKAMLNKPKEEKKVMFGVPSQKPTLGSKSFLEGKSINAAFAVPSSKKPPLEDGQKKREEEKCISLLTEEGLKKFEEQLNMNDNDISTIRSEWTASLYEVPIDKPWGLNLEKFLNNIGNGITTTQTFGTLGQVPPIEVQRKVMEDVIKSNKTMLSVLNSRKIHLENVQMNWELGDLSKTLNALVINKDTSAVMDFFNNTFVLKDNDSNKDLLRKNLTSIKITNSSALLSHIYTLLNSKYETYLIWGIKSLHSVFQPISSIIFSWRADIRNNREVAGEVKNDEKSRRLVILMKQLKKIVECKGVTKGRMRQNKSGELVRAIIPDIELFISNYN